MLLKLITKKTTHFFHTILSRLVIVIHQILSVNDLHLNVLPIVRQHLVQVMPQHSVRQQVQHILRVGVVQYGPLLHGTAVRQTRHKGVLHLNVGNARLRGENRMPGGLVRLIYVRARVAHVQFVRFAAFVHFHDFFEVMLSGSSCYREQYSCDVRAVAVWHCFLGFIHRSHRSTHFCRLFLDCVKYTFDFVKFLRRLFAYLRLR